MTKKAIYISIILSALMLPVFTKAQSISLLGRILLQVDSKGEAWYVHPDNYQRYFLGRPNDAFDIMKKLSLGVKHDFVLETDLFPKRLWGRILLDVENNGEAYYINPLDARKYYLGRPQDAFNLMREFGLGISNADIVNISIGDIDKPVLNSSQNNIVDQSVPFIAQAPLGDWDDQRQQDGCEESSAAMVVKWFRQESLSPSEGVEIVTGSSDYILEKYGEYRDVSSQDTIDWIFKDYFSYDNVYLKEDVSSEDIITELEKGNLLLVPLNGRLLGNPYFTPPGPPRHMLVVRGYDYQSDEFITNDPGTKRGEAYRYDNYVFYRAIRDYPTGYHEFIPRIEKNIIVIEKER